MRRFIPLFAVALAALLAASRLWAAANSCRYTIGAETVKDNLTGLIWQRAVPTEAYKWSVASAYCQNLNLGGSAEWRLPRIDELQSLVDVREMNPSIDTAAFPNTPPAHFWSSSGLTSSTALTVFFALGTVTGRDYEFAERVRCVR